MPVSLETILETTRRGLPELQARRATLERAAAAAGSGPRFSTALRRPGIAVIAEAKRRSPSVGEIRADLDAPEQAARYARAGAASVSILTDGPYFGGSLDDLRNAAGRVVIPLLRKDFILDEVQILEARAVGASAVLLIVRALGPARLAELLRFTHAVGLEALVEAHTREELDHALEAGAAVIGVNSRDLGTFRIDTAAAWELVGAVPADRIAVAESGMATVADVERAAAAGADAVLVGTALSAAGAPEELVRGFVRVPRRGR